MTKPKAPERRNGRDRRRGHRAYRRIILLVLIAYFLLAGMLLLLWKNNRDTVAANERAIKSNRESIAAQNRASKQDRETLAELCRTNRIIRGVMTETIDFRRFLVAAGVGPKGVEDRYDMNVGIMEGYLEQLDQLTACREVVRP